MKNKKELINKLLDSYKIDKEIGNIKLGDLTILRPDPPHFRFQRMNIEMYYTRTRMKNLMFYYLEYETEMFVEVLRIIEMDKELTSWVDSSEQKIIIDFYNKLIIDLAHLVEFEIHYKWHNFISSYDNEAAVLYIFEEMLPLIEIMTCENSKQLLEYERKNWDKKIGKMRDEKWKSNFDKMDEIYDLGEELIEFYEKNSNFRTEIEKIKSKKHHSLRSKLDMVEKALTLFIENSEIFKKATKEFGKIEDLKNYFIELNNQRMARNFVNHPNDLLSLFHISPYYEKISLKR